MPKASILIVEDEAIISLGMQDELEKLDYQVCGAAYNGEEALELAQEYPPDLVLMDINLPGKLDGVETALKLRQRSPVPVVFLTAMVDEQTIQRAKYCEPNGYIIKPIRQDELRTVIEHALYKHQLEQQVRSRADELEILAHLSAELRTVGTPQEMLPILLKKAMALVQADAGQLYLLGPAGNPVDMFQVSLDPQDTGEWFMPGGAQWARALASHEVWVDLLPESQSAIRAAPGQLAPAILSIALISLRSLDSLAAIMVLGFTRQRKIELKEQRALSSLAELGGNALHRSGLMAMLEKRVIERTQELAALYELTVFVNSPIQFEEKLEGAIRLLIAPVGADCAVIYRYDAPASRLQLEAQVNLPVELLAEAGELHLADGLKTWLETSSTPWLACRGDGQSNPMVIAGASAYHTVLNLPVRFEGSTLGLLCVLWREAFDLSAENIALLISIAGRIGSVIQNHILRQQAENAALLEERQRLARELHDSVTQSLYSLTLLAEAGQDLLAQNQLPRLEKCLADIGQSSLQALREMRMLLFELNPPLVGQKGLVQALQERLEAVERRAGVKARLEVRGSLCLPARTQEELYRVAGEALNNSLKHSGAKAVLLTLQSGQEGVEFTIEDDGRGFNPQEQPAGMGLATMRQRVQRLGGAFDICSAPGAGTRVSVKLAALEE